MLGSSGGRLDIEVFVGLSQVLEWVLRKQDVDDVVVKVYMYLENLKAILV